MRVELHSVLLTLAHLADQELVHIHPVELDLGVGFTKKGIDSLLSRRVGGELDQAVRQVPRLRELTKAQVLVETDGMDSRGVAEQRSDIFLV